MITRKSKNTITVAIEAGRLTDEQPLEIEGFLVFRLNSKAYRERPKNIMPAGDFEYKGINYAVYFHYRYASFTRL